jgi:putative nucleotidyltransferase with HDIG domain
MSAYVFDDYELIRLLAKVVEARDAYTAGHSMRVATYATKIAQVLELNEKEQDTLYRAGMLHDIGKVVTPDAILLKPGKLTREERSVIQKHAKDGAELIATVPRYSQIAKIVKHHHEHYDGSGYPDGLKKDEIPFLSRILCVADAFDAMTSHRAYRARLGAKAATEEIIKCKNRQFDPKIVDAASYLLSNMQINYTPQKFSLTNLVERNRLAYIFKDPLTDTFNAKMLNLCLNSEDICSEYYCCYHFSIQNMHKFNKIFSWERGDEALAEISLQLKTSFPFAHIFRVHGDGFVVLNHEHTSINEKEINKTLQKKYPSLSFLILHYDLHKNKFFTSEELQKKLKKRSSK